MSVVITAIKLGSVPAGCMLGFTLWGLGRQVSRHVAGALQHLAAGILLASIGTELLPVIVAAHGPIQCLSSAIGFFLGVAVLLLLGVLLPEHDDDHDDEEHAAEHRHRRSSSSTSRLSLMGAAQKSKEATTTTQEGQQQRRTASGEEQPLVTSSQTSSTTASGPASSFPAALLIAMSIDASIDGLLIGLVTNAGASAGPMLSASLSVEMGFLGLTLATALQGHPPLKTVPASILGPAVLVGGAALGGAIASLLAENPVLFVGLISFGTSALLFMVAEELLLEAHEEGGEHIWWVDLQLYVGFFLSLMMGKFASGGE